LLIFNSLALLFLATLAP